MADAAHDSDFTDCVRRVVETRVMPGITFSSVRRLTGGASQETYQIEAEGPDGPMAFAMRRSPGGLPPETTAENPGLDVEAELMRAARSAGVPEPEVFHVLEPGDGIGLGFIMEWIEGEALGSRINRLPEFAELRTHLAYDCGVALARIHSIDIDAHGLRGHLGEMDPEAFVREMWERYQGYDTPQPMIDYTARWLLENLPENPRRTLVHNDFRNGNFLVDSDGITAVLDWEVSHIGDPMRDLGWISTNSWRFGGTGPVGGFGEYDDFFRGYEETSGITVDPAHVHFWEVFGSFWWSVGCLTFADHYRNGPDKSVERAAVGRRTSECQIDCVNLIIPGPHTPMVEAPPRSWEMPEARELLTSVRDFLREDVMADTGGRVNFLARVAANTLDIALREAATGDALRAWEAAALTDLLGRSGDLGELKWALVHELRGDRPLADNALIDYLRTSVTNQIAIDQPKYPGFRTALGNGAADSPDRDGQ